MPLAEPVTMATLSLSWHETPRRSRPEAYERPALRNPLAAFPADSKVAAASFAVIATVVSISDKLPPAAAASIAEAAAFSLGNSPMTSQSWWPKVKYHPMSLPPTLLRVWQRLPHDFLA